MYLKFFMVKGFEEVLRDKFTESLLQSQKLGFNPSHESPVHIKSEEDKDTTQHTNKYTDIEYSAVPQGTTVRPFSPHIFLLVLFSNRDITPVRFEFVLGELPKGIVLHAERMVEN